MQSEKHKLIGRNNTLHKYSSIPYWQSVVESPSFKKNVIFKSLTESQQSKNYNIKSVQTNRQEQILTKMKFNVLLIMV